MFHAFALALATVYAISAGVLFGMRMAFGDKCRMSSVPLFLLLLWPCTVRAEPIALAEETNASLVDILTGMEILGERFDPIDATQPYTIRLIRVRAPGECDGSPETCPKETVYVAISSHDEYPDRKLYRLPDAYGWNLYQWSYFPQRDTPDEFIVFTMARTVIADDTSKGWWKTEYYVVRVNTRSATIERR